MQPKENDNMTRAIGLFSGGLDSILAVKLLEEIGVDVTAVTFSSPFFNANKAQRTAHNLDINVEVIDMTDDLLDILKNPSNGFGKNLNPCIDCHSQMLKTAGIKMEHEGYDFIFTGEVLGERPMSQNYNSLMRVAQQSGYPDYILRPLSALRLPETKPERDGLIDRSQLLDIQGRSRKRQLEMAQKYRISEFETPSGGCLLTYTGYCKKLKDLLDHTPDAPHRHFNLLRLGRHFRMPDGNKLIVGKNKDENQQLLCAAAPHDIIFDIHNGKGPVAIIPDPSPSADVIFAGRIVARYCTFHTTPAIIVKNAATDSEQLHEVDPFTPDETEAFLITA